MSSQEEINERLDQLKMAVNENPCGMKPYAFKALSCAMDSLLKGFFGNNATEDGLDMKFKDKTERRADEVRAMYELLRANLGEMERYMSRAYYYDKIAEYTGLSTRRIQEILNGK